MRGIVPCRARPPQRRSGSNFLWAIIGAKHGATTIGGLNAGFDINDAKELKANLKEQGIVDPAKVTREAIQNAVSVAGTAMTMGSLIVDLPEDKPAAPMGGGMPGGMGMDY